ncbi:MAG: branched-chain amino acid ABC transporter permease [Burkholderiaceae bacterium]|nr:branched-chain amino acid ABC transporter permease [Burkholderiaceae bacterium]
MATVAFKPFNAGRWLLWGATAVLFAILPLFFRGGFAITLLSQMGIFIIFCLSYNVIFGQGGMLSFGHAVYSGLGAYFAVHALNWITGSESLLASPIGVVLLPLVGGVAGAVFGVIFGYLTTKTAGTPFAMITLGICEMVHSASLMFPGFFGGEGGVSTNRVIGEPIAGITFGPGIQVYYLIAAWCFVSMLAMFAFSRTPLGRISNAVRDNPERVEFIGYSTRHVRFLVVTVAGFFAGISGGLTAINFELVTAENVSLLRSGAVLLAVFIGGAMFFFGPILGAVIFIFFAVALSDYTNAWQFYLGAFFVLMVMYAPGGVASLILMNLRVARYRLFGRLRGAYTGVLMGGLLLGLGLIMIIELGYHLSFESALSGSTTLFGLPFDATAGSTWVVAVGTTVAGALAFEFMRREFRRDWDAVQEEIQAIEDRERGA